MNDAHLPIAAFGGTFLMMVGLTYFFNHEKDVHWIAFLEKPDGAFRHHQGHRDRLRPHPHPDLLVVPAGER
jgi:hypothetical protein